MASNYKPLIEDLAAAPLADIISSIGKGVGQAQRELDEGSLSATLDIHSLSDDDAGKIMLREIGYQPTFYALPEVTAEVKVALTIKGAVSQSRRAGINKPASFKRSTKVYAATVDGGYSNRYQFENNISTTLKFKIVPIPPPQGAEELRFIPDFMGGTVGQSLQLAKNLQVQVIFVDSKDDELLLDNIDMAKEVQAQIPKYKEGSTYQHLSEVIRLTIE